MSFFCFYKGQYGLKRKKTQTWAIRLLLNFKSALFTSEITSQNVLVALKKRDKIAIKLMTSCYFFPFSGPFSEKQGEN